MKPTSFKMVCLDIDGTLINDDKVITAATRQEIMRVAASYGVQFVIASSRMPKSMEALAAELQTNAAMIAYNGALVLGERDTTGKREILSSTVIDSDSANDIITFAAGYEVHIGIYNNDDWLVNDGGYWTEREKTNTRLQPHIGNLREKIIEWKDTGAGPHKIMLRGSAGELDAVGQYIAGMADSQVIAHRIKDSILEIMPFGISKGHAIQLLCGKSGFTKEAVMAFGDSYNDIDMLQTAGLGIAMQNAPELVKQAADEVTASNSEEGIALTLRKYFA